MSAELRAKIGELYETNPQCNFQEVVLVVGPVPAGYLLHEDYADRYHLCARLIVDHDHYRARSSSTVVLNDGVLEQWYRRIA